MTRIGLALLAGLIALSPASQALAAEFKAGDLVIEGPWTRATPPSAKVAGGYMSIRNTGSEPDRLVGGSAAIAGRVEIHAMSVKDGVMYMYPVEGGLEIKPGETVTLKPGGYHVMFLDLSGEVQAGKPVEGTLEFARAGKVDVTFEAAPLGSATAPSGHPELGDGGHGAGSGTAAGHEGHGSGTAAGHEGQGSGTAAGEEAAGSGTGTIHEMKKPNH